jgi:hypothetical protein
VTDTEDEFPAAAASGRSLDPPISRHGGGDSKMAKKAAKKKATKKAAKKGAKKAAKKKK